MRRILLSQLTLRPRFVLSRLFAVTALVGVSLVGMQHAPRLWYQARYGREIDLERVRVVGVNSGALRLEIDSRDAVTERSEILMSAAISSLFTVTEGDSSTSIRNVWHSDSASPPLTVRIGDTIISASWADCEEPVK